MYEEKTLQCQECGRDFEFTVGEQEFYAEKGFENEPGRCPECRAARKQRMNSRRGGRREMFPAVCSACGKETEVPFRPSGEKPVYCRECFEQNRAE